VQRFPPKSPPYEPPPEGFSPFAIGYVELVGGERIEAVLDADPASVHIGMRVHVEHDDGRVPHAREAS